MGKIQLYQFGPLDHQESASPFCVKVRNAMRYKRIPINLPAFIDNVIADVAVAAQVGALNISLTPVAEAEIHAHAKVMRWLERTFEALG